MLLVAKQVLGALDVSDDVTSSSLKGSRAGLHCALNVDSALHSKRFGAFIGTDTLNGARAKY
jgi:hypothetical protein